MSSRSPASLLVRSTARRAGHIAGQGDGVGPDAAGGQADTSPAVSDVAGRIAALKTQIADLEARAGRDLVIAVVHAVGHRAFSAREVWAHRCVDVRLATAINAAGVTSPRQLGKRLKAVAGRPVDGITIERCGVERDGVVWCVQVRPPAVTI